MNQDDQNKSFLPKKEMTYEEYKEHVRERLNRLVPMFAKSSVGDFSANVDFPEEEDEFTEFYSGIQIMLDVIREQLAAERKRAEEWAALVSAIGEGVIVTDEQGNVKFMNAEAEKMLLWTSEDILGKKLVDIVPLMDENGNSISQENRPTVMALESKSKVAGKYIFEKKDSTKFNVFLTVTPYLMGEKTLGTIEVFRDITKEEEIEKRKDEFISIAAHQLRTPLGAMRWNLEYLLTDKKIEIPKDIKDILERVYASDLRLITLVGSLLSISRVESGKIELTFASTNLKQLARSVIDELQERINEKKHKLEFSYDETLPTLNIDARLVREVYLNLIYNAITYTPEGGKIEVSIAKRDHEVLNTISDNGIGIAKSEQHRLFEKFFRGERAVKLDTKGTGLGLYLVKIIVESGGGKIWYESEEGKGTTFRFTIPIKEAK